jgi:hypothetical protein
MSADDDRMRAIVREEVEAMLLDDTLGLHIRTVLLGMLDQLGILHISNARARAEKPN